MSTFQVETEWSKRPISEQISELEAEVIDLATFLEVAVKHHQHDALVLESARGLLRRVEKLRAIQGA